MKALEEKASRPCLVWDFDGTLVDTWYDIALTLNRALREEGFAEVEPAKVQAWIGRGVRKLAARAVPEELHDEARLEAVVQRFLGLYEGMCCERSAPYPGILDCLGQLADHPMAVASNKPSRFLAPMIERLGLVGYFDPVLGGDSLAESKPHPLVLTTIAAQLGVVPQALWMIGDSAPDIESARAVGARVIACEWGMRSREALVAAGPDQIVAHPREIPGVLRAATLR